MFVTTIEWHKPTEKLPEKSGKYLVCYGLYRANITSVEYSTRHKSFNAYDEFDDATNAIEVAWWAEMPEFPEFEK